MTVNDNILNLVYFDLIALVALFFFYFVGNLFFKAFGHSASFNFRDVFLKLLTGLTLVVATFSCYTTGFKSLSIVFVLVALFFWMDRPLISMGESKATYTQKTILFFLFSIVVLSSGIIVYRAWGSTNFELKSNIGYVDQVFYSKVSNYMVEMGVETASLEYLESNESPFPYHYFDLWLNSFFIKLTGCNPVKLMILCTYTVGIVVVWIGLLAIAERFKVITITTLLLTLPIIFYANLYLPIYKQSGLMIHSINLSRNLVDLTKLFPIYLFLIASYLLYKEDRYEWSYNVLLTLCVFFLSCAPGVFIFLITISLIGIMTKRITARVFMYRVCKVIFVFCSIAVFYKLLGKPTQEAHDIFFGLIHSIDSNEILTSINIIGGTSIQCAVVFIPVISVMIMVWIKKKTSLINKEEAMMFIIFSFSGLMGWIIYQKDMNGAQLFTNLFIPLSLVFTLTFFFSLIQSGARLVWMVVITQSIFVFYQDIQTRKSSKSALAASPLIPYFESVRNPTGACILNRFPNTFYWIPEFASLDIQFQEFVNRDGFHTISLVGKDVPVDSSSFYFNKVEESIRNSTFFSYAIAHPQGNYDSVRLSFINKYKIDYLLTNSDYQLSTVLSSNFERPIIDSFNQIKLYKKKSP